MNAGEPGRPGTTQAPPSALVSLEGLAVGVDLLDAVLAFHLSDAQLHALWVRPESGLRAEEIVTSLRDLYRVGQFTAKRLGAGAPSRAPDGGAPSPLLTLELPHRSAHLRRVRAHVVACLFDAAMPLGMARLLADRLVGAIGPELPLEADPVDASRGQVTVHQAAPPATAATSANAAHATASAAHANAPTNTTPANATGAHATSSVPANAGATSTGAAGDVQVIRSVAVAGVGVARPDEPPPNTLTFGSALPRRSRPPPPPAEMDRVSRLLEYLESHAPEPHVVRHRLALRAGLTLAALQRPASLGSEAVVLVETAVQDILGIDRAELRRIAS